MTQIELKPCPFCGGTGEIKSRWIDRKDYKGRWEGTDIRYVVRCTTCNSTTRLSFNEKAAAEMWNRRAK